MAMRGRKSASNWLTHGFWGDTGNTIDNCQYGPRAFVPWVALSITSGISSNPTEAMGGTTYRRLGKFRVVNL